MSPDTVGENIGTLSASGKNRTNSRRSSKIEVDTPVPIFKTNQGVSLGIFVTADCKAAATSLTYIKSRLCSPSTVILTASPFCIAVRHFDITPEYDDHGHCRGPNTLTNRKP